MNDPLPAPTAGSDTPAKASTDWVAIAKKTLLWVALVGVVWPTQYIFVAPAIWLLRFIGKLFKVLGIAAILIFIPFIGWIILFFVWQNRKNQRRADQRHSEMMAALAPQTASLSDPTIKRSIWSPWFKSLVTA